MMQDENTENSLKILREKTGQQLLNSEFKKNLFGGISQKEVIQYLNTLKDQAQQAEDTFKGRIEELSASRDTLKQENKLLSEQLSAITSSITEYKLEIKQLQCERDSLDKRYSEIEQKQEEQSLHLKLAEADRSDLRGVVEQLKEQLSQKESIIEELNKKVTEDEDKEEYESRILALDNTIAQMSLSQSKKDKQMERDSQLLVKLQKEKSDTELLTASLRADVANTYSQLEEQIKANHRLVMQLEKERIRASGLENRNNELEDKIMVLQSLNQEYQIKSDGLVQNLEKKYESAYILMADGIEEIMSQLKQYKNDLVITNKERKELSDTSIERFAQICSEANDDIQDVQRPSNIISLPKYKASGD